MTPLRKAVKLAALCVRSDGKRHSHQRRLQARVLNDAASVLQRALQEIRRRKDFDALMVLIREKLKHLHPLGELTVYDIAHRIGTWLGRRPEKVYLHRGTRRGAMALGFGGKLTCIEMSSLPREFRQLRPDEIEDCLCIYERELSILAQGKSATLKDSRSQSCVPAPP
jgi:hypothetical protein